jgi:hypothetical protein
LSDANSTRSSFLNGNPYYRAHAREAIAAARAGLPTLEQTIALERIAIRMHGRANRHELGMWEDDPAAAGVELVACATCGARARLSRTTGAAEVTELLVRCSS